MDLMRARKKRARISNFSGLEVRRARVFQEQTEAGAEASGEEMEGDGAEGGEGEGAEEIRELEMEMTGMLEEGGSGEGGGEWKGRPGGGRKEEEEGEELF